MSVNWTRCFYLKPVFIQRDAFMHAFFGMRIDSAGCEHSIHGPHKGKKRR